MTSFSRLTLSVNYCLIYHSLLLTALCARCVRIKYTTYYLNGLDDFIVNSWILMKYLPGSKTDMVAMETSEWNKFVQNLRRYRCEICGLQCRNKSGLETHLRVHTGEKPFRCSLCGRGFARGYDMKIHVNSCRKKSA